nr:DnaJ domain-containing protein [Acanthopleuribacter pedis]
MDETLRLEYLSQQDATARYGKSRRVKVIKNKGLGLSSEVLGVNVLMTWDEIKARYRFLLKCHHPDVGGDPEKTHEIIEAFKALEQEQAKRAARGRG